MRYRQVPTGVAVVLLNAEGGMLLGKRVNVLGEGLWGLPGGALESGESLCDCAYRELHEETGIREHIKNSRQIHVVAHNICGQPWVTVYFHFIQQQGFQATPRLMEPNKCDEWRYINADEINTLFAKGELFGGTSTYHAYTLAVMQMQGTYKRE